MAGGPNGSVIAEDWKGSGFVDVSDHIARYDPARVLADCAAKRAIVELHRPSDERNRWCDYCKGTDHAEYPCETSRILAAVYADHPAYDEAWRP